MNIESRKKKWKRFPVQEKKLQKINTLRNIYNFVVQNVKNPVIPPNNVYASFFMWLILPS